MAMTAVNEWKNDVYAVTDSESCACGDALSCGIFLQVAGAKIVTNAKSPGAKCYGFVMMASTEEASKCIQHLHRTELHGRMISVERVGCVCYATSVTHHFVSWFLMQVLVLCVNLHK